jgi:chemotaxis protein CheX
MDTDTETLLNEMAPIVASVFETMLDMETAPADSAWSPDPSRLIASVRLAGAWNGVIELECDRRQACRFAFRFLRDDDPDDPGAMSRDVLGELINMIGGNLKCALASGMALSSPSVAEEHGAPGAAGPRHHVGFRCSEGTFWVGLLAA